MQKRTSGGYTLIEILVGLTIVGLLFSLGFASFRDFSRRQALAGAVKTVQGDIRLTQSNALSGKKPDNSVCNDPNLLDGYVFAVTSTTTYTISARCTGSSTPVEIKEVTVSEGIEIASSPTSVLFKVLGQGTNIEDGESATITLTQEGTEQETQITISSGGEIK